VVLRFGALRPRDLALRRATVDLRLRRLRDWPDSDMAMAIAWRRLFTLPRRPRPLLSCPFLNSCITFFTLRFCRGLAIWNLRGNGT